MQKIFTDCQKFYYSSPNFAVRLFKIVLLSFPILLLWNVISGVILEEVFHIQIPDVFELFKAKNMPEPFIHFSISILGPIIETLIFQKWAFQIAKWLGATLQLEKKFGLDFNLKLATTIAVLLFAAIHYGNHYLYPILVLPAGLILGWIYLSNLQEFNSKSRAFWMTACFHMVNNGFATVLYFLEKNL
jgi:membrane protease YdiL (CAAX protease family)